MPNKPLAFGEIAKASDDPVVAWLKSRLVALRQYIYDMRHDTTDPRVFAARVHADTIEVLIIKRKNELVMERIKAEIGNPEGQADTHRDQLDLQRGGGLVPGPQPGGGAQDMEAELPAPAPAPAAQAGPAERDGAGAGERRSPGGAERR